MMKLGCIKSKEDSRLLIMAKYVRDVPAPPAYVNWAKKMPKDWGMMKNDTVGDCVFAACFHRIQEITKNAGAAEITIPDDDVLKAYSAVTGYVPGDESTDHGAEPADALKNFSASLNI